MQLLAPSGAPILDMAAYSDMVQIYDGKRMWSGQGFDVYESAAMGELSEVTITTMSYEFVVPTGVDKLSYYLSSEQLEDPTDTSIFWGSIDLWGSNEFTLTSEISDATILYFKLESGSEVSYCHTDWLLPPGPEEMFSYNIITTDDYPDGAVSIAGYHWSGSTVTIPETIEGYPVVEIGKGAFATSAVSEVRCEIAIDRICTGAFVNCPNLYYVMLSDVGVIETEAFNSCSELNTVWCNGTVSAVQTNAFVNCAKLKQLGATEIEDMGYPVYSNCYEANYYITPNSYYSYEIDETGYGCVITGFSDDYPEELTNISIPNMINGVMVTHIADGAFKDVTTLKHVEIPVNVTAIGAEAFSGCTGLESVYVSTYSENELQIGENAFYGCSSLEVIIPEITTFIAKGAYVGTKSKVVYIPFNTVIAEEVFDDDVSIRVLKDSAVALEYADLEDCPYNIEVYETLPYLATDRAGATYASDYTQGLKEVYLKEVICTSLETLVAEETDNILLDFATCAVPDGQVVLDDSMFEQLSWERVDHPYTNISYHFDILGKRLVIVFRITNEDGMVYYVTTNILNGK